MGPEGTIRDTSGMKTPEGLFEVLGIDIDVAANPLSIILWEHPKSGECLLTDGAVELLSGSYIVRYMQIRFTIMLKSQPTSCIGVVSEVV